jgi:hypothetical protein
VAEASDKEDNNGDDGMDEDHVPVKSSKGGRKTTLSAPKESAKESKDKVTDDDVAKASDEEDDNDDDGMDEDQKSSKGERKMAAPKESAKESKDERMVLGAQFSINIIDLFDTPKTIFYGKWNQRPIDSAQWKRLKGSMTLQGMKPFSSENMMPLVISPQHVDPSCIQNSMNGYQAKMLVLSEEGERELTTLDMAGGRHRMAAIQSIKEDKVKALKKLTIKRTSVDKRKVKRPAAVANKEAQLAELEDKIASLEDEISKVGRWGVMLYDKGK